MNLSTPEGANFQNVKDFKKMRFGNCEHPRGDNLSRLIDLLVVGFESRTAVYAMHLEQDDRPERRQQHRCVIVPIPVNVSVPPWRQAHACHAAATRRTVHRAFSCVQNNRRMRVLPYPYLVVDRSWVSH